MSMGETIGLKNLQQALARWTGLNMDVGVATGGTNTTAVDTLKNWPVNKWVGGQVKIIKANGQEYDRAIASNTATQLTFAALPGAIVVAPGDIYSVKETLTIIGPVVVTALSPLEKAAEHNTAELAITDILAAALTPTNTPCLFRVMCAFDTAGVFTATITRGANTQLVHFNNGAALTVDCLYIFDHLVHSGDTINYQYSVGAQLMVLRVQEIVAGVQ